MIKSTKKVLLSVCVVASLALTSYAATNNNEVKKVEVAKQASILEAYANIALDNYTNALKDAKNLKVVIDKFAKTPTQENFDATKKAWLDSRESYGSTEIFRLSNGPIESINRKIKDLKRLGRGFRNFEHFRNRFLYATRSVPVLNGITNYNPVLYLEEDDF